MISHLNVYHMRFSHKSYISQIINMISHLHVYHMRFSHLNDINLHRMISLLHSLKIRRLEQFEF